MYGEIVDITDHIGKLESSRELISSDVWCKKNLWIALSI